MLPRLINSFQILCVFRVTIGTNFFAENFAVPQDGIQRCTQLVTHVGEKDAFRPIGVQHLIA